MSTLFYPDHTWELVETIEFEDVTEVVFTTPEGEADLMVECVNIRASDRGVSKILGWAISQDGNATSHAPYRTFGSSARTSDAARQNNYNDGATFAEYFQTYPDTHGFWSCTLFHNIRGANGDKYPRYFAHAIYGRH